MSKDANPNGTDYKDRVNDNLEFPVDLNIVWNESGILEPGVKFQASEVKPSDPKE